MNGPLTRLKAANSARAQARAGDNAGTAGNGSGGPFTFFTAANIANTPITGARSSLDPPQEPIALEAPVIGYRSWALSLDGLRGLFAPYVWRPGIMRANHGGIEEDHAPAYNCQCGLYAYYEAQGKFVLHPGEHIGGAILAWGDRFFAHKEGFRAERAKIIALQCPTNTTKPFKALLGAIAEEHSAVVVPNIESLEAAAREHGDPVPAHARLQ